MDTIIFDLDGVIIDSEPINLTVIQQIYDEIGAKVPEEVKLSFVGTDAIKRWSFIIDEYDIKDTTPQELYHKERERILKYMTDPNTVKAYFPNLKEVLQTLKDKGFKTAVASSTAYTIIESILDFGDLSDYFDLLVSSVDSNVKCGKPEPDIFLYTAEKLGSKPENCLVIEDSEHGIIAAKRAGMKAAAFLSAPVAISTDQADYVFDNYKDFFGKVKLE